MYCILFAGWLAWFGAGRYGMSRWVGGWGLMEGCDDMVLVLAMGASAMSWRVSEMC